MGVAPVEVVVGDPVDPVVVVAEVVVVIAVVLVVWAVLVGDVTLAVPGKHCE